MNHARVDAALAAALAGVDDPEAVRLSVFVHLDSAPPARLHSRLAAMGVRGAVGPDGVCTANLWASEVAELSEAPGVRLLTLSGPVDLLDDTGWQLGPSSGS